MIQQSSQLNYTKVPQNKKAQQINYQDQIQNVDAIFQRYFDQKLFQKITDIPDQKRYKVIYSRKQLEKMYILRKNSKTQNMYLISTKWAEHYQQYLEGLYQLVGPIDNHKLQHYFKNQSSFHYKKDYIIVNQRIWDYLTYFYKVNANTDPLKVDMFFPVYRNGLKTIEFHPFQLINPLHLDYMISILQILFSIPELNYYFMKKHYVSPLDKRKKIYHTIFHRLVSKIQSVQSQRYQIKQFASYFQTKFNPYEIHSSINFFKHLCEILPEEMRLNVVLGSNKSKQINAQQTYSDNFINDNSIVNKLFGGLIRKQTQCTKCYSTSYQFEKFYFFQIDPTEQTIYDCLNSCLSQKKIQQSNHCFICKQKTKFTTKGSINKNPQLLVLIVKKFSITGKKIDLNPVYPEQLNLKNILSGHHGSQVYKLHSLVQNKGLKLMQPQYVTYSKKMVNQQYVWVQFSAQKRRIDVQTPLNKDAQILLYRRVN